MIQYPTNISPQNIAIDTANRAVIVPDISDWGAVPYAWRSELCCSNFSA